MVIYPPDTNAPCVTNYCVEITESSSQGTQVFHHIFEAVRSDRFQAFIITRNIIQSLNPCSSNYTFSVRACNSNETDVRVGQNLFKGIVHNIYDYDTLCIIFSDIKVKSTMYTGPYPGFLKGGFKNYS